MRGWNQWLWTVALVFVLAGVSATLAAEGRTKKAKVGMKAPDFTLVGSDGKTYQLSDYLGKQAVVIAWFPRAFTGG